MNDFFDSLKSDLLDRRLIPALGLLAVVLIAAVAYAVLGGGSSAPALSAATPVAPVAKAPGLPVSEVKTADVTAGAETTDGSTQQTGGASRNPFAPMPGVKKAQAAAAAAATATGAASSSGSSASTESGSSGSSSPSTSTGGATPAPSEETKKPSTPTKPKDKQTVFHVDVLFGTATAATPPQSAALTPFNELKLQQPLPSDSQPLVVFRGVLAGGKSATFTLVGEAILRGPAKCLPSASQCQAIDLQPGQTEELEYLPPGGMALTYELNVVSISSSKAKLSSAHSAFGGESKTGLELLRSTGLQGLSGLRYTTSKGVLVFAGKHAFAARAHIAVAPARASALGWPFKG
jgi:hypothetical protein